MLEEERLRAKSFFVLMPRSNIMTFWNVAILFPLLYTATIMPIRISFIEEDIFWIDVCEVIVDIMFLIDIIVNFFAAYEEKGKLVRNLSLIRRHYIKTWFFPDVVALIPWNLITVEGNSALFSKLFRLMRLPRIYRLVKLFKTMRMIKHSPTLKKVIQFLKVHPGITRLLRVMVMVFLLVHLMSCFWYLVAKYEEFSEDSWV